MRRASEITEDNMRVKAPVLWLAWLLVPVSLLLGTERVSAQAGEPYKLGTFSIGGRRTVGVVLRDAIVIDLAAANAEYEKKNTAAAKVAAPADMKDLIARYDSGVSRRIKQIVAVLVSNKQTDGAARPAYVRDVAAVTTLAPIIYPGKSLNAAANYYGHAGETGTPEEQRKEAEARRKDRGAPYLFLKAMEGALIGNGDDILLPRGRERIDWECELAVVIGRKAKYVPAGEAKNYIFGYTIELDMSDRGGRPEKEPRFGGSDWFIGKSHDTFAPMGPWIVPKEFYPHPMNVGQKLTVNGTVMQDSRSTDMIHDIYDLVEYSSSILTLFPGDVISSGSPAGTGMSRSVRPEQIWLKPGDKIVATIEGIGTMTHTVKADPGPAPRTIWVDTPKTEAKK
jgi:2-keto-4-pentenoate hydratase/2-oxohepta-3-ene-1,7-dioic acid hydratase in catechol pathway